VFERVQTRHYLGNKEVRLKHPRGDDEFADEVNRSHVMGVIDSLKPSGVRDRKNSIEVDSSADAPCTRKVGAGEEGGPVFRNVVEDAVDDLLGKAHVACLAYPEGPLQLPGEVFAVKP